MTMICFMPIVLGPKYAVRLSDLETDFALQFGCMWCDHISIMPATFFQARFPAYKRIIDIEHMFRCGKCRNKVENSWQVVRQVRQDVPSGTAAKALDQTEDPAEDSGIQKTRSGS